MVSKTIPALLFTLSLSAQTLTWTQLKPSGPQPSARFDGAVAFDPTSRQLYMFGGQDTAPRNDLWSFSFEKQAWTQLTVSGGPPAARFGHTLVFDSARRALLLFGGQAGTFYSDVWAFDIAGGTWHRLASDSAGPNSRYGHGAAYDAARDQLVITHGFTTSGRFDDTWAFSLKNNTWKELTPSGTKPLKRCLFHSALDAPRNRMYLYGGCASGFGPCPLDDLWWFDLTTNQWTQENTETKPPARQHNALAFDAVRSKLVIYGGDGASLLSDTWEFDPAADKWQTAGLAGSAPSARSRQETAYAGDLGIVIFGGSTAAGLTNELWSLTPTPSPTPSLAVIDAFSGAGESIAPGEVVSIYGSGLGPAAGAAQAFDASGKLPITAAGTSVTFNGVPAPLYYVSASQLNVQVPYEIAGTSSSVVELSLNGKPAYSTTVPVTPTHPGVFPLVFNADFSINTASNPAPRGSIIFFFATGQGVTSPPSITGTAAIGSYPEPVGNVSLSSAEVVFKGQAPGTAGVMQINARLAPDAPAGSTVPLLLTVGNAQTTIRAAIK